jgi:predicted GNAT family N-acyltransferase
MIFATERKEGRCVSTFYDHAGDAFLFELVAFEQCRARLHSEAK